MATKNDITGDLIQSKPSKTYSDNWEKIFGKSTNQTTTKIEQDLVETTKSRSKAKE